MKGKRNRGTGVRSESEAGATLGIKKGTYRDRKKKNPRVCQVNNV